MQELSKLIAELEVGAAQLEAEKARADALFWSIGDGAISTDEEGKIEKINSTALELLGFEENELKGKWLPKVIGIESLNGKKLSPIDRPIMKAILYGKPISERVNYFRKDGSKIPVSVTVSPIMIGDKPIGAVEVFRDITHELEVDRMKSEFISLASHQLRTPLSAIMLYANMLQEGYQGELNKGQKEFVEIVITSVNRMIEMVNLLLNISRIEAGRIGVSPKPTDLSKLVKEILTEIKPKADEKHQKITFEQQFTGELSTDPLLTKEVFINLLSNAVKYTPDKGSIQVSLKQDANEIVYIVKDNGLGIPKNEQGKMFTKFFRASNVASLISEGTGLGMYLVKEIVKELGGRIWFESKEGKGTTFYFALPASGVKVKEGEISIER